MILREDTWVGGDPLVDRLSPERRSWNMRRIKGRDTTPELQVRRLLHALGYRYHLHRADLPGTPDIVFPGRRKVVLLHGCYWHRHPGCKFAYTPKSRITFWKRKFAQNIARDVKNLIELETQGWTPLVVWECETRDRSLLEMKLVRFLGNSGA
jgi:DNA mismatch endonuclease (patch repair protein)